MRWRRGGKVKACRFDGEMKNLEDVKAGDVPLRMNELFPDFRFWYFGSRESGVVIAVYRKGVAFRVELGQDDIRRMYSYDSVVPIEKKLTSLWNLHRDLLISCMRGAGEPPELIQLMDAVITDNEDGYLVTGLRRKEDADEDD